MATLTRSVLSLVLASYGCGQRVSSAQSLPVAPLRDAAAPLRDATAITPTRGDAAVSDASAAAIPAQVRPLNVVLVTIDSVRGDLFFPRDGSAANPTAEQLAPNIARLMQRGVVYSKAYALSSYTSMSVGGFLSGRLPSELARDGYFFGTYARSVNFLAERLQSAGVRTLAAHAHFYFRGGARSNGLNQGFDDWRLLSGLHPNPTTDVDITSERHVDLAIRMLSDPANTSGRFFAHFHLMDPHDQYLPHPGGTSFGRTIKQRYMGEVNFTDGHLARLVDFIQRQPWGERTAIILSADHGEAFGEHGFYRHAFKLWQELVHVPWVFVVPGVAHRQIDLPRSHLDLAPTVLELMGIAPASDLPGVSLVSELRGAAPAERDVWVDLAQTSNFEALRALIHGHHKILAYDPRPCAEGSTAAQCASRYDVFDLQADPTELHPLRRTDRATHDAMTAVYARGASAIRFVPPYAWHPPAR